MIVFRAIRKRGDAMRSKIDEISNEKLTERLNAAVREERRFTIEVLRLLHEVERRDLFARMGFSSLFTFCVEYLKYSESAAQRRIVSMRALREMPELAEKIETGSLSLSVLALTESTLRQNAKLANRKVRADERRIALEAVDGLSRRNAELALVEKLDLQPLRIESVERPLRNGGCRIILELTREEKYEIEELRRLSSRPQTEKEMILGLVRAEVAKRKRKLGETPLLRNKALRTELKPLSFDSNGTDAGRTETSVATSAGGSALVRPKLSAQKVREAPGKKNARNVIVSTKRAVWLRADARCEHRNEIGIRCFSRHSLEFDHVLPKALGGSDEPGNLRLLCRTHHRLLTTAVFGPARMREFRLALRYAGEGPTTVSRPSSSSNFRSPKSQSFAR